MSRERLTQWSLSVGLLAIALDQAIKGTAAVALPYGQTIPTFIPGLDLRLVLNLGAAFGLGARVGPLLAAGILILLIALTGWIARRIIRRQNPPVTILLALTAAGGWGNMIDRVLRAENGPLSGAVIDYLSISWFAIFNLADVFAVGGVCAAILVGTLQARRPQQPQRPGTAMRDEGVRRS